MEDLSQKARELQNEYQRNYRLNNKERIAKINKNYWLKKAKEQTEGKN